jgi:hypothetical protein
LFDPALSGGPYVRPIEQGHPGRYVGVPVELWRNGWIISLSATAPALLLVLVEHKGGYSHPRYVVGQRLERYGLTGHLDARPHGARAAQVAHSGADGLKQ